MGVLQTTPDLVGLAGLDQYSPGPRLLRFWKADCELQTKIGHWVSQSLKQTQGFPKDRAEWPKRTTSQAAETTVEGRLGCRQQHLVLQQENGPYLHLLRWSVPPVYE